MNTLARFDQKMGKVAAIMDLQFVRQRQATVEQRAHSVDEIGLHEHTINKLATIKRRENLGQARFLLRDMMSLRSNRLFEYEISQGDGENSGKEYDTPFTAVSSCIRYMINHTHVLTIL